MVSENIKTLLKTFGEDTVAEMVGILTKAGKDASGKLIQSLRTDLREALEELTLEFSMEDYGVYVDKGRRPGKQPPLSAIQEWCTIKGIDTKAAFPIARKIGREGIPPTEFFEIPLMLRLEMLSKPLEEAFKQDLLEGLRAMAVEINK